MWGLRLLWTRSSSIPTSRKRSVWRNRRLRKRTGFFRGRQIACLIYDYFWVTGAHDTVLDHADLFTTILRNDDGQEFDTRWTEIPLSMTKIALDQLKTVLELYDTEIHQKTPNAMVKRSIDQKLRLRNVDRQKWENWNRDRVLKEDKENAINAKQKDSDREETSVVSGTMKISVQNRLQKSLHPLNHQHKEVECASRKKNLRGRRSPSGKSNRQPCKNFLKGTCTKLPCDYWHLPECQF